MGGLCSKGNTDISAILQNKVLGSIEVKIHREVLEQLGDPRHIELRIPKSSQKLLKSQRRILLTRQDSPVLLPMVSFSD